MLTVRISEIAILKGIENAHQLARATKLDDDIARRYWIGDIPDRANFKTLTRIADSLGVRLSDIVDYYPEGKSA